MRLFVAVTPPAAALAELAAVAAPLQPAWPALRWTRPDSWHVTLAFLGETAESVLPELRVRLQRAARRHPSLELSISGVGAFPAAVQARVLWAGIHGDQRALQALAWSVAAGARRAGAPPPDERSARGYRPHLTLARCKVPSDLRSVTASLADLTGTAWTAGQIHLIRSYLQPRPHYETLDSWPLGGSHPR
jgi:2'-5' RNA ligase